jgi:hypothetical protein
MHTMSENEALARRIVTEATMLNETIHHVACRMDVKLPTLTAQECRDVAATTQWGITEIVEHFSDEGE